MGISPWVVGQTAPPWQITLNNDSGQAVSIVGTTISGRAFIQNHPSIALGGVFTIVDGPNGVFSYKPVPNDFAIDGPYEIFFTFTFVDGSVLDTDRIQVTVKAAR